MGGSPQAIHVDFIRTEVIARSYHDARVNRTNGGAAKKFTSLVIDLLEFLLLHVCRVEHTVRKQSQIDCRNLVWCLERISLKICFLYRLYPHARARLDACVLHDFGVHDCGERLRPSAFRAKGRVWRVIPPVINSSFAGAPAGASRIARGASIMRSLFFLELISAVYFGFDTLSHVRGIFAQFAGVPQKGRHKHSAPVNLF